MNMTWLTSLLLTWLPLSIETFGNGQTPQCKVTPGSPKWPSVADWQRLNHTLSGHLLKPYPQAAVCHPDEPTFDRAVCKSTNWTETATYTNDPLGIINPNWSKDCCLPSPQYPCSGSGFPVYVVKATCAEDVAAGINFARKHNIRPNVKGSGHDYLGRSVAPQALSIWTKHIRGIEFHGDFRPQGCNQCESLPAVTLAAGVDWGEIYAAADARGLTLVGGTGDTIGLGGYLTGGGHSPLSAKYGLAVDQVVEMQIVTPGGEMLVANEATNSDLFWAMRGGGGATFGIMTSVTLKTFPTMPVASIGVLIGAAPNSDAFWNFTTFVVAAAPRLQERGIMGYSYVAPSYPYNGTIVGGYLASYLMPNGTLSEMIAAASFVKEYVSSIPGVTASFLPVQYSSLYEWYKKNKNTTPIGGNLAVGNRLLDGKALSDVSTLRHAMEKATPGGTLANLNLVAGPGLWAAKPAGGSDSVTPAWRKAYVEYAIPVNWPFRDATAKAKQTHLLTDVYVETLRDLAPDTGSYLNEGDVNEPNFQEAYWGSNYPRLLEIKKRIDPQSVLWCAVCVGSEGWAEDENGRLCRLK